MSLVLHPGNHFTVVRQIENHLDAATYYVQAVIRNAYTDAVIETLDLTSRGSQRFSKNWLVPADPSGQGFYISIVTSVYTDSGYTTKSDNYGDQETTYLIEDRVLRGGGGGGLDAYTIRRILKEELAKAAPTFEGIYGAIGALQREINRIPKESPEMRWNELLGVVQGLQQALAPLATSASLKDAVAQLDTAIRDKEVMPETDLTPLTQQLEHGFDQLARLFLTREDEIASKTVEAIKNDVLTALKGIVSDTTFQMAPTTMRMNAPKPKEAEPITLDLNALAS